MTLPSKPIPKTGSKKNSCPFCGNSPVNHLNAYVDNSLNIAISYLEKFSNPFHFPSMKPGHISMEQVFFSILSFLRIVKFGSDIEKALSFRSRVVWLEAKRRGIPMEQVIFFRKPTEWYRTKIGGKTYYFSSLPIPPHLWASSAFWIDDKHLLKKKLSQFQIPTPRSGMAISKFQALSNFRKLKKPVIVKPSTGSRGRHTTTFITEEKDLVSAFKIARQINYFIQVEEHLSGYVCRATLVDGGLRGFLKAYPGEVVGDGVKTLKELIREKNEKKHPDVGEVKENEEMREFLRRQGYGMESVLPKGKLLPLHFRTGRLNGGTTREMLPSVHPKLKAYLEKAARSLQIVLVGFDLIIEDPEKDPDLQRWGIIEANSLPFIDLHDFAFEGKPANVAEHIWNLWEKK